MIEKGGRGLKKKEKEQFELPFGEHSFTLKDKASGFPD